MNLRPLNQWRTLANQGLTYLIVLTLGFSLVACGSSDLSEATSPQPTTSAPKQSITEVSPPVAIQKLHQVLDQYQPQVTIISPQPDEVLQDNTVNVQLNIENLPIFQEDSLGLGPHLQVILDNQPTQAIYDLSQPLTFKDLEPGTHTLRVFAAYPWDESYKNPEAYDQTVFHLFTRTPSNNPDLNQPLLTLNLPTGTYGAEPILLDFYLANLPVNPVDTEDIVEDSVNWQVQMTLNGERFLIDQWQPIYIKGVKSGKNWIQLQYLDGQGQPLNNVYNNTVKVFTYNPEVSNSLSQLFKGEFSEDQLQAIVDPDYVSEIVNPVPEVAEPEAVIEPDILEENPIEESEPVSEEPIFSPVEGVLEDTEEPTATETPETEAVTEESVEEAMEEPTAAVEPVVEEEFPEILEQPEAVEEPTTVLEPAIEEELSEFSEIEADSEPVEVITEDSVKDSLEQPEAVEEPTTVLEPTIKEELSEFSKVEADSEPVEVVTEDSTEQTIEATKILEEPAIEAELVEKPTVVTESVIEEEPSEIPNIKADNLETVIQIDETAETPIMVRKPVLEKTKIEDKITEIPKEMIEIDETPDLLLEESPEVSDSVQSELEQPEPEGWFNSIRKRIQLPFFKQEAVEMTEPNTVESVTIPEETSTLDSTEVAEPLPIESVKSPEETSASESILTKFSKLREWLNLIFKKIQLPNQS